MPIIQVAANHWVNTDAVGAIDTVAEILANGREQERVTEFRSIHGQVLLRLTGRASFSTDSSDSNHELKAMNYRHDEAIAAVRDRRDAVPFMQAQRR
jgi:hypothetical protein